MSTSQPPSYANFSIMLVDPAGGEDYAKERGCIAFLYSAPTGSRFARLLSVQSRYRHSNSGFLRSL